MRKRVITLVLSVLLLACNVVGPGPECAPGESLILRMKWFAAYPGDNWTFAKQGLWWALSNLGAQPPASEEGITVISKTPDAVAFDLDLARCGFHDSAWPEVVAAVNPLLNSEDMRLHGYIDVSRFLMKTLYEPFHYYRITGVPETLARFRRQQIVDSTKWFAVTASLLTDDHRLVEFNPDPSGIDDIGFIVSEGHGSLIDSTFEAEEFETIDLMANGRQRFAVFDSRGQRIDGARISPAGQPGKCMWCHEMTLQKGSIYNQTVKPFLSYSEFLTQIQTMQNKIEFRRSEMSTSVNFEEYAVHTRSELLVEMFLSASAERIALEWSLPPAKADSLLRAFGITTHIYEEYPEFGPKFRRGAVDSVYTQILSQLVTREAHPLFGKDISDYRPLITRASSREL